MKSLAEILSDGSIVDNTVHTVLGTELQVGHRPPISIHSGNGCRRQDRAWGFLRASEARLQHALSSETESGLVLFHEDAQYEHNTTDALFSFVRTCSPESFTFATGNLVGVLAGSHEGYQFKLRVSSRFGDEFLKFIIADAEGFKELPDQGGDASGDFEWLLIYLWLIKLKKAYRLGLPKAYETSKQPLTTVRGRLDPLDYALNSERGRYRCTFREHSYDNEATRLIARTLQHLDGHAFLRDAHSLNQTFQIATGGARHSISELIAAKPLRNPYFADYNEVMSLSKRILRNELADFGQNSRTSAFFFDVSMLFEYFVRKLLQRAGARLKEKNGGAWEIATGGDRTTRKLIPDLVFELDGRTFLFDVKYKSFDFLYGVKREDLFQLHTYLGQLSNLEPIAGCGFIYPIRQSRWHGQGLRERGGLIIETITQHGKTIPFVVAFLPVPEAAEDQAKEKWGEEFRALFGRNCENFVARLFNALGYAHVAFTRAASAPA